MSRPSRRRVLVAGLTALPLAACTAPAEPSSGPPAPTPPSSGSTSSPGSDAGSGSVSSAASSAAASSAVSSGAPRAGGSDITHGSRAGDAVALTFHGAGDAKILTDMLAVLKEGGAQVTVLAIGQWLAGEPDLARRILDAGHDLGNHTWSHRTMPRLTAAQVDVEIERAAAELRTLTGGPGRWFRPSGTPSSTPAIRAAAVAAGYGACLGYDVDPLDYTDPGAAAVARNVAKAVRPGSIVSLHLGHAGTLQAMPEILDQLRGKGLRAVTATGLLGAR